MAGPPPKPKKQPEDLAEVERALSVLQGRHPETERLRREDEEKRAKRQAEQDAVSKQEGRRVQSRRALMIGGGAAAVLVAIVAAVGFRSELARLGRLEEASDPYRAMGFALVDTSSRGEPSALDVSVSAGCVLATSTVPSAKLKVAYAGGVVEGPAPVLVCLCEGGHVKVSADGVGPGEGVALLRAEAAAVGGSRAFAFLPFKPGATGQSADQACAEASLDAWLDARRWSQETAPGASGRSSAAATTASPSASGSPSASFGPNASANQDANASANASASANAAAILRPVVTLDAATRDRWFDADPKRAALRAVGLEPSSSVKREAPFVVLEVPAASCVLLVSDSDHASDKVSVRMKGGALGVGPAPGNAGWCTSAEAQVVVQREGEGELTVLVGPAARVGGLFGLKEVADSAALSPALGSGGASTAGSGDGSRAGSDADSGASVDAGSGSGASAGSSAGAGSGASVGSGANVGSGASAGSSLAVAAVDRGWSAKQLLMASAVPETLITVANAPDLGNDPEARIVVLSVERPNAFVPETPPDVYSFCDPPLDQATSSLCVFSGTQKWRVDGAAATGGIARAKLPFWLFGLQGVGEPAALKVQTGLIALSRRLRREGFEPTTIEAVIELDRGAEVLGRANEDAMVVFGLTTVDPWVLPYTDGPAWTIDGDPRVVPIKPLERVTVSSTARTMPPKNTRRTVVFRRQKR